MTRDPTENEKRRATSGENQYRRRKLIVRKKGGEKWGVGTCGRTEVVQKEEGQGRLRKRDSVREPCVGYSRSV